MFFLNAKKNSKVCRPHKVELNVVTWTPPHRPCVHLLVSPQMQEEEDEEEERRPQSPIARYLCGRGQVSRRSASKRWVQDDRINVAAGLRCKTELPRNIFLKLVSLDTKLLYLTAILCRRLDETPRGSFSFHWVIYLLIFDWKIVWQEFIAIELLSSSSFFSVRHYVHIQSVS